MKIIDLLNKIANGEEVPNKIIWNKLVYELKDKIYFDYCGETLIGSLNFDGTNLNDEVEILEEEKKIPKKITAQDLLDLDTGSLLKRIVDNQNEIIDYFHYLKSKGDE